jgi:16S rRNA C967 or C1407 C5-methylase (RsmB/RsmF family)
MSNKLPPAFIRSLIEHYNIEEEEFISSHENGEQLTSVRINAFKPSDLFNSKEHVPWCENGRYLKERPSFTADPLFHAGCYYVQEASSMFLEQVLKHSADLSKNLRLLDLCAAPGGKSFLCALKLKGQGLLISNDRSAARRARIHQVFDTYIPKTEQKNLTVTSYDATKWSLYQKNMYDKVLLDAPCSSERHVLEDSKELALWAPGRTKAIAITQFAMLASALDIVKVGGTIVYSTCALSQLENDDIIAKLYQKRAGRFELVRREFSFGEATEFGWQVLPDTSGWGPFYLAVIKRVR